MAFFLENECTFSANGVGEQLINRNNCWPSVILTILHTNHVITCNILLYCFLKIVYDLENKQT